MPAQLSTCSSLSDISELFYLCPGLCRGLLQLLFSTTPLVPLAESRRRPSCCTD